MKATSTSTIWYQYKKKNRLRIIVKASVQVWRRLLWARGSLSPTNEETHTELEPVKVSTHSDAHAEHCRGGKHRHLIPYELIHPVTACVCVCQRRVLAGQGTSLRSEQGFRSTQRPLKRKTNMNTESLQRFGRHHMQLICFYIAMTEWQA